MKIMHNSGPNFFFLVYGSSEEQPWNRAGLESQKDQEQQQQDQQREQVVY